MAKKLLQVIVLLSSGLMTTGVMAHGNHAMVTPGHGLEHAFYYGIGIVAGLFVLNIYRSAKSRNSQK